MPFTRSGKRFRNVERIDYGALFTNAFAESRFGELELELVCRIARLMGPGEGFLDPAMEAGCSWMLQLPLPAQSHHLLPQVP